MIPNVRSMAVVASTVFRVWEAGKWADKPLTVAAEASGMGV